MRGHLRSKDGMIVLVPPYDTFGVGFQRWVQRDEDGTEHFLGDTLECIHPVCPW